MPDEPMSEPLFAGPADSRLIGDEGLLAILEAAIADERAAQQKYREWSRALRRPRGVPPVRAAPER